VVCDEHGIRGDGEYFGDNDAQLDRINAFHDEASGGRYVPRAVLFNLEPGVTGAVRASPLGELFRPGSPREQKRGRGQQLGQGPLQKGWARILLHP
jgi:tubulin beta